MKKHLISVAILTIATFSQSNSQAESSKSDTEFLKCLSTYNEVRKHYDSLSIEDKYGFTLKILEHSYGKKAADEYLAQKEVIVKSPEKMDVFFKSILMEITESCTSDVNGKK